jgi:1-acylglycerone phosphate reductase
MAHLTSVGIETLTLDVLSDSSIAACVAKLPSLDILINNAGGGYSMPVSDISILEAKKLFDLNVWSYLATTQAFLPLLLKSSSGMIVNQTSVAGLSAVPFQSTYNASKAAMTMFSETQRLELGVLGITVVELKTGLVKSNLLKNKHEAQGATLPKGSVYEPAREVVEKSLGQMEFVDKGMEADVWAKQVTRDLLKKKPPPVIWNGEYALLSRVVSVLPFGTFDGMAKKMTGLAVVEQIMRA